MDRDEGSSVAPGVSRETPLGRELRGALGEFGLDQVAPRLEQHWKLLQQWNQRTNLTAIESPIEAAWLHYRDSLELLPHLPPGSLVDLGSGGGFPGIPLALCQPERPITLLESRRKKCSFLESCVARLALPNVTVRCARMEDEPPSLFAVAVTRATFSSEQDLLACLRWVPVGGELLALRAGDEPPSSATTVHRYTLRGARRHVARWVRTA